MFEREGCSKIIVSDELYQRTARLSLWFNDKSRKVRGTCFNFDWLDIQLLFFGRADHLAITRNQRRVGGQLGVIL